MAGAPVLRRCRITRNGLYAVRLSRRRGATLEACDLSENRLGPWDVAPGWVQHNGARASASAPSNPRAARSVDRRNGHTSTRDVAREAAREAARERTAMATALQTGLLAELEAIVGAGNALAGPAVRAAYAGDGSLEVGEPGVVVLPQRVEQVAEVLRLAGRVRCRSSPGGPAPASPGGQSPARGASCSPSPASTGSRPSTP